MKQEGVDADDATSVVSIFFVDASRSGIMSNKWHNDETKAN